MMRILMFVPQYPYPVVGGLEKQAHELAKALLAKGVTVLAVSGRIGPEQPEEECVEGVAVTRTHWAAARWVRFLRSPWGLARVLWTRRHDYEVVHVHQHSWVGLYVVVLAKLLRKPVLVKLPNVGAFGLPGLRRRPFGLIRLRILLWADAIVAMSTESIRELTEVHYPLGRVLRSPNGIRLASPPRPYPLTQDDCAPCRVVFVGRLSEEKGLDVLLEAWQHLRLVSTRPVSLFLWGDGPLASTLKATSARLGLASRVHFAGQVTEAAAALGTMDIFVLASSAEGNSNAVLEAMAAGLPIVATAVGGTPMQVGPEGAAFLCPPGDPQALAAALRRLVEDPALRGATGAAMRRRAEQYFDIDKVADCYLQTYRYLAQGHAEAVWDVGHPLLAQA
jgi:glycosyltransferase involved in cell wall biosynthesis